jgi:hypothetical protein
MPFAAANATTVLYQNFNQLVDSSEHVVLGTVKNVVANKKNDGDIYTVITLQESSTVTTVGRTPLNRIVKIRIKGGTIEIKDKMGNVIGEETLLTHGVPEFSTGEKVVLFVSKNGVSDMPIVGWGQGVFRIDGKNSIRNVNNQPVVGLSGADLITLTDQGLMARGQYLSQKTGSDRSTSEGIQLISSTGGADKLVTHRATENAVSKKGVAVIRESNQIAFDKANFISMIQERLASGQSEISSMNQTAKPVQSLNNLFELPQKNINTALAKDDALKTQTRDVTHQTQLVSPTQTTTEPSLPVTKSVVQHQDSE